MVFVAFALVLLGMFIAVFGHNLFRGILPLVGLIAGFMVGYGGVQGVLGTGAISTTIALLMALIVGVVMMLLSFVFFEIAVYILTAMVGATALSYLGIALRLGDNGFLMALLAIAGAVLGFVIATRSPLLSTNFIIALTSFAGVSFVLGGIFLIAGDLSLDTIHNQGIISSVIDVVDQSFIWFIVWLGGSLVAMNLQQQLLRLQLLDGAYAFKESK